MRSGFDQMGRWCRPALGSLGHIGSAGGANANDLWRQGRQPIRSYARIWALPLVAQEPPTHGARMSHTETLTQLVIVFFALFAAQIDRLTRGPDPI